jgi:selenocysteine lyase/cysteine desulfurase
VAQFVGADPADIVFVTNATFAMNCMFESAQLQKVH